jgi:hypothetical protein
MSSAHAFIDVFSSDIAAYEKQFEHRRVPFLRIYVPLHECSFRSFSIVKAQILNSTLPFFFGGMYAIFFFHSLATLPYSFHCCI